MTIKQIDVQQLRPGMHVCDAAGTPHGIVTDRYSLNQRMYVTLRTSVDVQHMAPVPFDFQVYVIACSMHNEPMVREAGGPGMTTIHGRTYCPTCQAELLTAMSNSDMIHSGAVDELVADMDRQEFIEKIAGLPKGARARIFEQESTDTGAESYTVAQIREAFRKHATPDDWGIKSFYEDGLIASLRGEYDNNEKEN